MHLVGLRLQVFKESMNAIPLLGPVTLPAVIPAKNPVTMLLGQVLPGNVGCHTAPLCMGKQFFLAVQIRLRLPGLDGTLFKT